MTYQIKEQMQFWNGKQLPQYPEDDGYPTPEQIKVMVAEISKNVPSTDNLRRLLGVRPSSQNINTQSKESDIRNAGKDTLTEAVKHDDGKPDWSLVPFESLEGMVKVLEFGAKKYDNWNWTTNGGFPYMRVMRSCLRHLFAWSRGEDLDPESGLSHIHHAMCNLLFISHYIGNKEKFNKDDRNKR
jgi:hypothetical protein